MRVFAQRKRVFLTRSRDNRAKIDSYELCDKPFAKALLLSFCEHHEEVKAQLTKMLGRIRPVSEPDSLAEFAETAAILEAHRIGTEAMKRVGREAVFLPHAAVPNYAPLMVAYTLFVLAEIRGHMHDEQIDFDFRGAAAQTANLFFVFHSDEARTKNVLEGLKAFDYVVGVGGDKLQTWAENLGKLVRVFVLQRTMEPKILEKHDLMALFGSMLSTFLAAAE